MYKLILWTTIFALAAAKPGFLHGGVPTFVSSPAVVSTYSASPVVAAPIVARAVVSPIVTYSAPAVVHAVPVVKTPIITKTIVSSPVVAYSSLHTPVVHSAPIVHAAPVAYHSSPVVSW
ncbi:cuticle protein 16.5-like [Contarinia nasturtii]|uniref:cuticle protein 16.5-like n=1 Tax=Contarinia nasturtii TaxID=265458 RepID=UPI0012D4C3A6|nr:cuticle protein 16.5-like [Contarinia nasturtii]